MPLLLVFAIISFFIGILLAIVGIKIFYWLFIGDEDREKSEEIDVMEKWTTAQQN